MLRPHPAPTEAQITADALRLPPAASLKLAAKLLAGGELGRNCDGDASSHVTLPRRLRVVLPRIVRLPRLRHHNLSLLGGVILLASHFGLRVGAEEPPGNHSLSWPAARANDAFVAHETGEGLMPAIPHLGWVALDSPDHGPFLLFVTKDGAIARYDVKSDHSSIWGDALGGRARILRLGSEACIVAAIALDDKSATIRTLDSNTGLPIRETPSPCPASDIVSVGTFGAKARLFVLESSGRLWWQDSARRDWNSTATRIGGRIQGAATADTLLVLGRTGVEAVSCLDSTPKIVTLYGNEMEPALDFQLCEDSGDIVVATDSTIRSIRLDGSASSLALASASAGNCIAATNNAHLIAIAGTAGPCQVYDSRQPEHIISLESSNGLMDMQFIPKTALLAGLRNEKLAVWDASSGKLLTRSRHFCSVISFPKAPSDHEIASAGRDGGLKIWDDNQRTPSDQWSFSTGTLHGHSYPAIQVFQDHVLAASPYSIQYWQARVGTDQIQSKPLPREFSGGFDIASISPDLQLIAYVSVEPPLLRLFKPSAPDTSTLVSVPDSGFWFRKDGVGLRPSTLSWSSNSTTLYAACEGGGVLVLDTSSLSVARLDDVTEQSICALVSCPNGLLAFASESGEVRAFLPSASHSIELRNGYGKDRVVSLAVTPDSGFLAICTVDGRVDIIELNSGESFSPGQVLRSSPMACSIDQMKPRITVGLSDGGIVTFHSAMVNSVNLTTKTEISYFLLSTGALDYWQSVALLTASGRPAEEFLEDWFEKDASPVEVRQRIDQIAAIRGFQSQEAQAEILRFGLDAEPALLEITTRDDTDQATRALVENLLARISRLEGFPAATRMHLRAMGMLAIQPGQTASSLRRKVRAWTHRKTDAALVGGVADR